jgi:hypothetical protein
MCLHDNDAGLESVAVNRADRTIATAPGRAHPPRAAPGPRRAEDGGERQMDASHMTALVEKHANLERQIQEELTRPAPDDVRLHDLKKRKLAIKDQITHH